MRTPKEARLHIRAEIEHGAPFKPGMCKEKCREAYLIPSDGSTDAAAAWAHTQYRLVGSWVPGAFAWWTGGTPDPQTGRRHGHVAITALKPGVIFTVDHRRTGHWNRTTIDELEKAWPRIVWAGMSLDIDGHVPRLHLPHTVHQWSHS